MKKYKVIAIFCCMIVDNLNSSFQESKDDLFVNILVRKLQILSDISIQKRRDEVEAERARVEANGEHYYYNMPLEKEFMGSPGLAVPIYGSRELSSLRREVDRYFQGKYKGFKLNDDNALSVDNFVQGNFSGKDLPVFDDEKKQSDCDLLWKEAIATYYHDYDDAFWCFSDDFKQAERNRAKDRLKYSLNLYALAKRYEKKLHLLNKYNIR